MRGRGNARRTWILIADFVVAAAIISFVSVAHTAGAPDRRSDVAGSRVSHEGAIQGDQIDTAVAQRPTVAETLAFFHALLYPPPTVAETLVFFQAMLYPPPSVAEVLIFFHELLYARSPEPAAQPASTAPPRTVPSMPAASAAGTWTDASFTQAVWDSVNARRAQQGIASLAVEPHLRAAAARYAVLMSERSWFSHTGPDGSSFVDRLVAAGFPFTVAVGEVLAMGSEDWPPREVVQAWIDSPAHRDQLLNAAYTRAGLECAFTRQADGVTVRCVMEFAAG